MIPAAVRIFVCTEAIDTRQDAVARADMKMAAANGFEKSSLHSSVRRPFGSCDPFMCKL